MTDLRGAIIAQAKAYPPFPYGLPPGPGETDCSLFVQAVVFAAGAGALPRTAEQQRQACVPIGWDDVLSGDLLWFSHTYEPSEAPGPDGEVASHVGISLGRGSHAMFDAHERTAGGPAAGITNIGGDYWQSHLLAAGRLPSLVDAPVPAADGDLTDEPDHLFTFAQLWPPIKAAGAEFAYDARALAGIIEQESGWRNWRVHRDGTGHGLLGLDDNGLLPSFERWSGLAIGRGASAGSIPIVPQLRYAAFALADYATRLGGPYAAARAWHRGEGLMNDALGQQYEALIRAHVAELFAGGEPPAPTPDPVYAPPGSVGTGILALMAEDNTAPALPSTWLPLGSRTATAEECVGLNGCRYIWHLPTGRHWRYPAT